MSTFACEPRTVTLALDRLECGGERINSEMAGVRRSLRQTADRVLDIHMAQCAGLGNSSSLHQFCDD